VATVMRDGSPSTPPPTGDSALRHCSASTCEFDQVGRSSPSELVDEVPDRAVGQVVRANVLGGEAFGVEQCLGGPRFGPRDHSSDRRHRPRGGHQPVLRGGQDVSARRR
jgi:hypothetical protein